MANKKISQPWARSCIDKYCSQASNWALRKKTLRLARVVTSNYTVTASLFLIVVIHVAAGLMLWGVISPGESKTESWELRITDEHNRKLASIFDRAMQLPIGSPRESRPVLDRCQQDSRSFGVMRRLAALSRIFEIPVVHALDCQITACTGHRFILDIRDCPPACDGNYYVAISDPSGSYDHGYHYDGTSDCLSACATCSTDLCANP